MDTKKGSSFSTLLKDYENLEQLKYKVVFNESTVSTVCDKLNLRECEDLIRHIKFNFSLVTIFLRNKMSHEIVTDVINMEEARNYFGTVFYTSFIIENFMRVLCNLIFQSEKLRNIVFIKMPSEFGLQQFCSAIRHNKSLRILHIEDCDIRDEGCIQICQALRRCPIASLALINCNITSSSIEWLSWLIKEQTMLRKMIGWKPKNNNEIAQDPKLHGLRKLNVNDNPKIQDNGAKFLINTLFEDTWLKHIHMQNTGITESSCVEILKLLHYNRIISVFDIERNSVKSTDISFISTCLNSRNIRCLPERSDISLDELQSMTESNLNIKKKSNKIEESLKLNINKMNGHSRDNYNMKKGNILNDKNLKKEEIKARKSYNIQDYYKRNIIKTNYEKNEIFNRNMSSPGSGNFQYFRSINKSEPGFYKTNYKNNLKVYKETKNVVGKKTATALNRTEENLKKTLHSGKMFNILRKKNENINLNKFWLSSSATQLKTKTSNKINYFS